MAIPPDRDWLAYCFDEAIHVLSAGHEWRDRRWDEAFRRQPGDEPDLYDKAMADPRSGRPPSLADIAALDAAVHGRQD